MYCGLLGGRPAVIEPPNLTAATLIGNSVTVLRIASLTSNLAGFADRPPHQNIKSTVISGIVWSTPYGVLIPGLPLSWFLSRHCFFIDDYQHFLFFAWFPSQQ